MIYNKSLQRRFVSGRFTPLILLGVSVLMWLVGIFVDRPVIDACICGLKIGNVVSRCITFACFALATAMMSSWYIFDRRIRWFLPLTFFLPSVSLFVHGALEPSFSLLFVQLVLYRLFLCNQGEDNRYGLFTAFMLLGLAIMFVPSCVMLLFPFLLYVVMMSLMQVKELFAIVLGLLTPYWFLFAIGYIFPNIILLNGAEISPLGYIASTMLQRPTLYDVLIVVVELLLVIPFLLFLYNSSYPGKPVLRKRLRFFALFNLYLIFLSLLYNQDFVFYYVWGLPAMGVMLTYIFSLNITRLSRFYFVAMSVLWLVIIPFSLWLRYL